MIQMSLIHFCVKYYFQKKFSPGLILEKSRKQRYFFTVGDICIGCLQKKIFLIIFIIAVLRFFLCDLDRFVADPEIEPPAMFQFVKLKHAGFAFAPKRIQEPLPNFPSQSHFSAYDKTQEISSHSKDIFESYNPVKRGCL